MSDDEPTGFPWWLWPNVLALDAPAVAVAWQRFLAGAFGVAVPPAASAVLALVVWGIYLADRRLDALRGESRRPRHAFAARRPGLVAGLAAVAFLTAVPFSISLPSAYLVAGTTVAACVLGYLALVHVANAARPGAKESLVGILFAAGVGVPLLASHPDPLAWLPAVAGFGLLCWLNCRLIDLWESETTGPGEREPVLGVGVVLCAAVGRPDVGLALALSVALLLLLHVFRRRVGADAARALADLALLTPLPWLW